jgi:hypothetical protein
MTLVPPQETLFWPRQTDVTYGVKLTNPDEGEANIRLAPMPATSSVRGAGPVLVPTAAFVDGPALMTSVTTAVASPSHEPGCDHPHGAAGLGFETYALTLPPRSESVLVVPFNLIAAAWPGEPLAPRFTLAGPGGSQTVQGPAPALVGPPSLLLRLESTPRARPGRAIRIRRGRRVLLRGTTRPAARGQRISLRVSHLVRRGGSLEPGRSRPIARALADRRGGFQSSWTPKRRGTYGVYAVYRSRTSALADGALPCSLLFDVR